MLENKKFKGISFFVTVLLVCFFAYQTMAQAESSSQLISSNEGGGVSEVGKETLVILLKLKSLSLDDSIFRDKAFEQLKDFSIDLEEKPTGRNNPFASLVSGEEFVSSQVYVADSSDDGSANGSDPVVE